ncbi:MAG: hypothetical protein ABFR97_10860 [Thermodesulfobacteriota bacterium]
MPCPPFFLLAVLLLILQTAFFPLLPGWLAYLDPLFVLLVFIAIRFDPFRAALMVTLIGMLLDIFSGIFSGLHPLTFLCLLLLIKTISHLLALVESIHQVPLVLASYIFVTTFSYGAISTLSPEAATSIPWQQIIIRLFMLAIITMPLFSFFDLVMTKFTPKKALQILIRPQRGNRFR